MNGGRSDCSEHFDMPFSFFTFRDPEDVFREFFQCDPFSRFAGFGGSRGNSHVDSLFGFSPFAGFGGFGNFDLFGNSSFNDGVTSFSSVSFFDGTNKPGVKKTSTSTRFVNGHKIETKK